jgi:hypothetical protein
VQNKNEPTNGLLTSRMDTNSRDFKKFQQILLNRIFSHRRYKKSFYFKTSASKVAFLLGHWAKLKEKKAKFWRPIKLRTV